MLVTTSRSARLEAGPDGNWRFEGWMSQRIAAGVTSRSTGASQLLGGMPRVAAQVEAEQVHGASIAIIGRGSGLSGPVPGCDALVTHLPGVALLIRTADCIPMSFADPVRGAVGIAHVGWRGLAAELPMRVVAAFRHAYHSRPEELHVALGPAIRACCYDVGADFPPSFAPFIQERSGRHVCDLVGMAMAQLQRCGVRTQSIVDAQRCTACEPQHWFSLRREGSATGRLTSAIMLRPSRVRGKNTHIIIPSAKPRRWF